MYTYTIYFHGRRVDSAGRTDLFSVKVIEDTVEKAILSLYDRFEHIRIVSVNNEALTQAAF